MNNSQIAKIFELMSVYIEMNDNSKSSFFRARALKKAAEAVDKLDFELNLENIEGKDLTKLEGIGKSTSEHIIEFLNTGKINDFEQMKSENPIELEELLRIQFLGPKKIKKLYEELNITNIEQLKTAAENGLISNLDGFGKKSEDKILKNIELAIVNKDKVLYSTALNEYSKISKYITENDSNIIQINPGGSLRRKKELIGDIDILISTSNENSTIENILKYKEIKDVLGKGDKKVSLWLNSNIQCDIRIINDSTYGAALQYFTGNVDHNVKLRNIAISKGYKLSEYGLLTRDNENIIAANTEKEIYNSLGLEYISPELREDNGEFELAATNNLPKLIELNDIKGDYHTHTIFSDGANTAEEMIEAAISKKYEFIGITDHIGNLVIANAIYTKDRFDEYFNSLTELKHKYSKSIKVYIGAEVEVTKEGDLDFDDELLSKLDYVIAGTHLNNHQSYDDSTNRFLRLLNNPLVKIIAHPAGRLLLNREGIDFDFVKVAKAAIKNNIILEINASPSRLDLDWHKVKILKDLGGKTVINTDAHSVNQLEQMIFGVNNARKGYITKDDIWRY